MAFGGGFNEQEELASDINVTPMVDVMLVLLVIFILAVPVLTQSVNVNLPQAPRMNTLVQPEMVSVSVDATGIIHWNGNPVGDLELETKLAEAAAANPQPEIRLYGDKKVAYEHVIRMMAMAQKAGIQKLGFVTEPQK